MLLLFACDRVFEACVMITNEAVELGKRFSSDSWSLQLESVRPRATSWMWMMRGIKPVRLVSKFESISSSWALSIWYFPSIMTSRSTVNCRMTFSIAAFLRRCSTKWTTVGRWRWCAFFLASLVFFVRTDPRSQILASQSSSTSSSTLMIRAFCINFHKLIWIINNVNLVIHLNAPSTVVLDFTHIGKRF